MPRETEGSCPSRNISHTNTSMFMLSIYNLFIHVLCIKISMYNACSIDIRTFNKNGVDAYSKELFKIESVLFSRVHVLTHSVESGALYQSISSLRQR